MIAKRNPIGLTLTQNTFDYEQSLEWSDLLQRAAVVVVGLVIAFCLGTAVIRYWQASDPYIQEVLAQEGNASRGQAIFQMNCAVCHGIEATGEVGPNLRGVSDHRTRASLIKQVISGKTPPMPQFQPNPQDMADLLEYLEKL